MKNVSCPSPDAMFTCPYWKNFMCTMPEEDNAHPKDECDEYYYYNGEE